MSAKRIDIINGPNLNLLGVREPEIYGSTSFDDFFQGLLKRYSSIELSSFQSNWEGELIDRIQESGKSSDGIILNAAGYSHTSVAIADAVAAVAIPVIGVHISNIFQREEVRHNDLLSRYCTGYLFGFGLKGYELALSYLLELPD